MKVVILAGGMGTRLSEETAIKPKPMVEIGRKPIIWHIMKYYAYYGFKEFVVALGYKGDLLKQYFLNYHQMNGNLSVSLADGNTRVHDGASEDWVVHLVDTGLYTNTGGRIKRLAPWLNAGETFMLTYGDGVSNVDLRLLLEFHRSRGKLATVTAVRPPARFGSMSFDGDLVNEFIEKPLTGEGWINGGFFVLETRVLDYIKDDVPWEREPLYEIARDEQLAAFRHDDFWQCMDTYRELKILEEYWQSGEAPWKVWE